MSQSTSMCKDMAAAKATCVCLHVQLHRESLSPWNKAPHPAEGHQQGTPMQLRVSVQHLQILV